MSLLIKNWSLADWKELLMWAKIGANNAMIGEFSEVEEIPPHGRLIDADALKTKGTDIRDTWVDYDGREDTVRGFSLDMLDHAPTIIPADPAKEGEGC